MPPARSLELGSAPRRAGRVASLDSRRQYATIKARFRLADHTRLRGRAGPPMPPTTSFMVQHNITVHRGGNLIETAAPAGHGRHPRCASVFDDEFLHFYKYVARCVFYLSLCFDLKSLYAPARTFSAIALHIPFRRMRRGQEASPMATRTPDAQISIYSPFASCHRKVLLSII